MSGMDKMQGSINRTGRSHKLSIHIVAFLTGFLLFTVSFSLLINDVYFNSNLYKSAFEKLKIYNTISELAGIPAREFSDKISVTDAAEHIIPLKSMIEENTSYQRLRSNTDSLVSGLISYFKGETNSLPNLSFSGSTALTSVNLQVLMMYTGESRISNIFGFIRLAQYTLAYFPIFLLFLLPFPLIYMLKKSTDEIKAWIYGSVFSFWLISLIIALLIQLIPGFLLVPVAAKADLLLPSLSIPLLNLFAWFQNTLTFFILLSGTLLYMGVHLSGMLLQNKYQKGYLNLAILEYPVEMPAFSDNFNRWKPVLQIFRKNTILIPAIVLLSASLFFAAVYSTGQSFDNRNLGQTLSLLWENNPICPVTDARNDLVYLLEVHTVDSNSKPVPYVGIHIAKTFGDDPVTQKYTGTTDADGNADFLLDNGSFSIELEYYDVFNRFSNTQVQPIPFQLDTPGKSILKVKLDKKGDGLLHVANTSLQFIP